MILFCTFDNENYVATHHRVDAFLICTVQACVKKLKPIIQFEPGTVAAEAAVAAAAASDPSVAGGRHEDDHGRMKSSQVHFVCKDTAHAH